MSKNTVDQNQPSMLPPATPEQLLTILEAARLTNVPTLLWGAPGIGKSSLITTLARHRGVACEAVLGSLREPSDFAGLPVVTLDGVRFEAPRWAKNLAAAENGGLLFLDELTTVPHSVQKAMLSVVLDRVVGDLRLNPSEIQVIAAANPVECAADGWDLAAPLANRFLHLNIELDPHAWASGIIAGFPVPSPQPLAPYNDTTRALATAHIAAFIRHRPNLLLAMPTEDSAAGHAWPSPRSWDAAARILAVITDEATQALALAGLVGLGAAHEFTIWRSAMDLPDPADVIADPAIVEWAALTSDRAWAVLTGVVAYAAAPGTTAAWRSGWTVLAVAADHGHAAIGAACALDLMTSRPSNATPPASVKKFAGALAAAGYTSTA